MTLDLESLRLVIAVLDYDEQDIACARHIVELALAELAARRIIEAVRNQAWPQNSPPNPHAKRSMKSANALFCQRRQWMRWPDLAANWPSCNKRRAGNRLRLRRRMEAL